MDDGFHLPSAISRNCYPLSAIGHDAGQVACSCFSAAWTAGIFTHRTATFNVQRCCAVGEDTGSPGGAKARASNLAGVMASG
jgi:hypothetical protein